MELTMTWFYPPICCTQCSSSRPNSSENSTGNKQVERYMPCISVELCYISKMLMNSTLQETWKTLGQTCLHVCFSFGKEDCSLVRCGCVNKGNKTLPWSSQETNSPFLYHFAVSSICYIFKLLSSKNSILFKQWKYHTKSQNITWNNIYVL